MRLDHYTLRQRIFRMLDRILNTDWLDEPNVELTMAMGDVPFMDTLMVIKQDLRTLQQSKNQGQQQYVQEALKNKYSAYLCFESGSLRTSKGRISF